MVDRNFNYYLLDDNEKPDISFKIFKKYIVIEDDFDKNKFLDENKKAVDKNISELYGQIAQLKIHQDDVFLIRQDLQINHSPTGLIV